ncbi:hypothetical protein [Aquimarina sp. SS2-1]|uniref:hypothetical protein n=1 Tax=Aquimarina besae TaxID=3342247 RepID=UPI00366A62A0
MKKAIYIILAIILPAGIGIYFYDASKVLETHKSPDGDYVIIVKRENSFFTTTMPGDGGTNIPVEVILKNTNGKVIGTSSSNKNCGVLWFSIEINWDLENHEVWYGRGKTINLKTGEVSC